VNHTSYKKPDSFPKTRYLTLLLLTTLTTSPFAKPNNIKEQWGGQCATPASMQQSSHQTKLSKITNSPYPDAIYLEADDGTISLQGTSRLEGNIVIQRNNTVFNADKATFNRENNSVIAEGNVILSTKGLQLKSSSIEYGLQKNTGIIKGADYTVGNDGAHGKSSQINQLDKNRLQLKDATFTTCPAVSSPFKQLTGADKISSWHLASSNIHLDQKTQLVVLGMLLLIS
jgi:lipopolysaccharide assembly outer membrane protein LptD (OstA)